jgi:hypothetical protein
VLARRELLASAASRSLVVDRRDLLVAKLREKGAWERETCNVVGAVRRQSVEISCSSSSACIAVGDGEHGKSIFAHS